MSIKIKASVLAMAVPILGVFASASAFAVDPVEPACKLADDNRTGICGDYKSEISVAEAFVNTVVKRGKWSDPQLRPVILDVRSAPEYLAGHPEHSYNVPYPYIHQTCDDKGRQPDGACFSALKIEGVTQQILQDKNFFVEYVRNLIPNTDTPIYTMCRTGVRSVGAADALTAAGYTNVNNMFEGFVGVYLKVPQLQTDNSIKTVDADLDHDGKLTDEDKNGWRYFAGLPYDTRLLPKLMYDDPTYPGIYALP